MKRNNKKGFTIIELVVVIAVIAILAAVLIPTFSNIIKKANTSADIQAVNQMNKHLAIEEVTGNKTIVDVYSALAEGGMTAKDYHPLTSNTYFFWVKGLNRIVYTDNDYQVIYPSEYEGKAVDALLGGNNDIYLSLSGDIKQEKVTINEGVATVSNAEQLYYLSKNYSTSASNLTEIKLANDINLKGANVAFIVESGKTLKLTGKQDDTTLTGLVTTDSKLYDEKVGKDYACGLIANVESTDQAAQTTVEVSNVTIENATVGGYEIGGVGALIGRINSNTKVTVENCKVINTVINGKNKVGALIGSVGGSNLTIKGCEINDCTVNCSEGESGKAIGCVYNKPTITIDKAFDQWVTDTTLNLVSTTNRTVETDMSKLFVTKDSTAFTDSQCEKIVRVLDDNGQPESTNSMPRYRMFASDAYMAMLHNLGGTVIIDNSTQTITGYSNLSVTYDSTKIDINVLYFFK